MFCAGISWLGPVTAETLEYEAPIAAIGCDPIFCAGISWLEVGAPEVLPKPNIPDGCDPIFSGMVYPVFMFCVAAETLEYEAPIAAIGCDPMFCAGISWLVALEVGAPEVLPKPNIPDKDGRRDEVACPVVAIPADVLRYEAPIVAIGCDPMFCAGISWLVALEVGAPEVRT